VLDRDVAVKVVGGARRADPIALERFKREAVTMASISHPNICSVYDVGSQDDQSFMVMELLTGPSVSRMIADEGRLSLLTTVHIGAQVARGLSAAHAIGITHRDIKPGNILRHHKKTAKIVDFGIARLEKGNHNTLTSPAMAIGTAAYMSPEQARGKPVRSTSDVYSFGCLLTAMLLGHPPFVDADPIEVARMHAMEIPESPALERPELPRDLVALVSRMLVKRPEDRPAAAQVAVQLTRIEMRLLGQADPHTPQSPLSAAAPASPLRSGVDDRGGPRSQATPLLPEDEAGPRRRWWLRRRGR